MARRPCIRWGPCLRPVANATLCKIADALPKAPVIPGVDDLLGPSDMPLAHGQGHGDYGGTLSAHPYERSS